MLDPKTLLDQFLGSGSGGRSLPGQSGQGSMDLSDLSRQIGGGLGGGGGGGGLGKGAVIGGLAGLMLGTKRGRKLGTKALKVGGLALVGGLAWKAYQDWQAGQKPASGTVEPGRLNPPSGTAFNPDGAEEQRLATTLIRAMIAAAKADGHIDGEEQSRIFGQMDRLMLDNDAKAFLMDELRAPLDIDAIARSARNKEEAAEIYMASLLAIDPDETAERGYLTMLAGRLGLEPDLVAHLEETAKAAERA